MTRPLSAARDFPGLTTAIAAAACGAPQSKIMAVSRGRANVAWARHVAVYLQHVALGASLSACGRLFGRDRASIRHACARVEDARDDPRFDEAAARLECALRAQRDMLFILVQTFSSNGDGGRS